MIYRRSEWGQTSPHILQWSTTVVVEQDITLMIIWGNENTAHIIIHTADSSSALRAEILNRRWAWVCQSGPDLHESSKILTWKVLFAHKNFLNTDLVSWELWSNWSFGSESTSYQSTAVLLLAVLWDRNKHGGKKHFISSFNMLENRATVSIELLMVYSKELHLKSVLKYFFPTISSKNQQNFSTAGEYDEKDSYCRLKLLLHVCCILACVNPCTSLVCWQWKAVNCETKVFLGNQTLSFGKEALQCVFKITATRVYIRVYLLSSVIVGHNALDGGKCMTNVVNVFTTERMVILVCLFSMQLIDTSRVSVNHFSFHLSIWWSSIWCLHSFQTKGTWNTIHLTLETIKDL